MAERGFAVTVRSFCTSGSKIRRLFSAFCSEGFVALEQTDLIIELTAAADSHLTSDVRHTTRAQQGVSRSGTSVWDVRTAGDASGVSHTHTLHAEPGSHWCFSSVNSLNTPTAGPVSLSRSRARTRFCCPTQTEARSLPDWSETRGLQRFNIAFSRSLIKTDQTGGGFVSCVTF